MTSDPNREVDRPEDRPLGANDIYRKLEERAIAESNELNRRITHCDRCRRKDFLPAVGSGHPYGDVLLLKYQPRYQEASEGVAFFGRAGSAVLKSVERLDVDPLLLYGTNMVKCPEVDWEEAEANCPGYFLEEFQITQAQLVVVMGEKALRVLNAHRIAGMNELEWRPGELQDFTPFCQALVTTDVDDSLDDKEAKKAFWKAFRTLGEWHQDEPPY